MEFHDIAGDYHRLIDGLATGDTEVGFVSLLRGLMANLLDNNPGPYTTHFQTSKPTEEVLFRYFANVIIPRGYDGLCINWIFSQHLEPESAGDLAGQVCPS